jgi:predicted nucleotidyltransferase
VVLYGSAASGEHIPKQSDYNVLVLVDSLDVSRLNAVAAVVRAWSEAANPPPFTLTKEEWRRSADIFPMEYSDIQERHRVLYGESPFDGVRVAPADLRRQLESEAMGKLLHLRQGVLAAGGDGRRQLELLEASKSTIMVLFRATLRLHGETPPADTVELCRHVARLAGLDAEPFVRVVRHVRGEEKLRPNDGGRVLSEYVRGVQQLVAHIDRYTSGS